MVVSSVLNSKCHFLTPDTWLLSLSLSFAVAHQVYGVAQTINCANYMYFKCMAKVMELDSPRAAQAFTDQLLELHRGQGMDIYWRDAQVCPTEDEYKEMVLRKTGGLFELAVQLMQTFSEDKRDYGPLLEVFGLYFQIRDDYANLQSKEVLVVFGFLICR
eukprot:m.178225 g.178225  ORF g.178225 m.178225 type:complete len:160 (+) comp14639_c0_seq16:722-1201(+)